MLYIGQNRQSNKVIYSEENKDIHIEVNGSDGVKTYDPYEYLRLYGIYIGLKATDEESEVKQMSTLVDGRAMLVHLIENIKRKSEGKEINKEYKYNGFIRAIDAHIQMSKAELESKLLQSQIETNSSQITTNDISKKTNSYIAIFTAFAGGWYLYDILYRLASEDSVIRHLSKVSAHYKNLKFIPCLLITILAFLYIYAQLRKGRKAQIQKEETKIL